MPGVRIVGKLIIVVGKAQISGKTATQFQSHISQHAHPTGLVIHWSESVKDGARLRERPADAVKIIAHIQGIIVRMAITYTQMNIHCFCDIGPHPTVETEFDVRSPQPELASGKGVLVDDLGVGQQLPTPVQSSIKLQLLVQDKQASADIGINRQKLVLHRHDRHTIHAYAQMKLVKLVTHFKKRIDFHQKPFFIAPFERI